MINVQEGTPQFLLIVREWLRPGGEAAYNENELQLTAACRTFECPHPYLALVSEENEREIWWLNAFASAEERDGLDDAYARNERLMAALVPLGKRKEEFRVAIAAIQTTYRPDVSGHEGLKIAGARFLVVTTMKSEDASPGSVFESSNGDWFRIAPAPTRAVAEEVAAHFATGTTILAVQPQWSCPAESWIRADPEFWRSGAAAQN